MTRQPRKMINTNPVIIRKILTQLKNAGLINVARGTGGIELTRDLSEITFFDVYEAIDPVEGGDLFRFHEAPNPECPVGRNIHALLDDKLKAIQNAMEAEMKKYDGGGNEEVHASGSSDRNEGSSGKGSLR